MGISPINSYSNYSALSQANWIGIYGFSASKDTNLPEVEPVSVIGRAVYDVNGIDYNNVEEYEKKVFGENTTDNDDKKSEVDNSNKKEETKSSAAKKQNGEPLTEEEKVKVEKLKARDTAVKAHEQAHLSVAGDLATSGASYTYQQGPDGKQYAVGGEVNIDMSAEDSPEKTIAKMQRVIAAAMAPADPSSQDYAVASSARQLIGEMKSQITQGNSQQNTNTTETRSINKNENSDKIENNTSNIKNDIHNSSIKQELNPQNNNTNRNNISNYNINNQLDTYQRNNIFASQHKGLYANFVA
jgi:hypothetical protein